ncbi:MAG TPA: hypothetical protein VK722_13930 [Candidatus Aquilonibacter sp.]|jgi:hypothetical protein|nr:hypothetical protein [Candidatus Aquilonibacter sp.]
MSLPHSASRISRTNRSPISLNPRVDHRLLGYAAAATAAGVGTMALAQPSQAEVVYTPTNQVIKLNTTLSLDLNNDGVTDFFIRNLYEVCIETSGRKECSNFIDQSLQVTPVSPNGVGAGPRWAPPLPAGEKVGLGDRFAAVGSMEFCNTSVGRGPYSSGPWRNKKDRYLALEISIDGEMHYGWARLSVGISKPCKVEAVLTGYAYETVPGKPILTGATSDTDKAASENRSNFTIGALALGSAGLVAWRRDEEAAQVRM